MRILILTFENPFPPRGGFNNAVYMTAKLLAEDNEVYVISWGKGIDAKSDIGSLHFIHHGKAQLNDLSSSSFTWRQRVGTMNQLGSTLGIPQLLCTISKGISYSDVINKIPFPVDLIINELPSSCNLAKVLSSRHGIPLIERFHWVGLPWYLPTIDEWLRFSGVHENGVLKYMRLLRPSLNEALIKFQVNLTTSSNLITVTTKDKELLLAHGLRHDISVIHSAQPDYSTTSEQQGFPELHNPYFVFFSTNSVSNSIALNYLNRVSGLFPNIGFFVTGIPVSEGLTQRFRKLRFMGYLDNKLFASLLSNTDGILFPMVEGHGLQTKLITALSIGRPVVATSAITQSIPVLENEKHLLIRDTPDLFTQAIRDILESSDTSSKLSYESKIIFDEEFSINSHKKRMKQYIDSVLKQSV